MPPGLPSDLDQSLKSQTLSRERELVVVRRQLDAHADAWGWSVSDRGGVAAILGLV